MADEPFAPTGGRGDGDGDPVEPSSLPGAKGMVAVWERAFRGTHVTAPVLREMELWEIGVALDGDVVFGDDVVRTFTPEPATDTPGDAPTGPRLREAM